MESQNGAMEGRGHLSSGGVEAQRRKIEPWWIYRPEVADWHHFEENQ